MGFNISKKRASQTGDIELKNGDGTPMLDDAGNPISVTVHGPASKVWEQAHADKNRKRAMLLRKNGGRMEAALDNALKDQIEFLCRVTICFNGDIEHPDAAAKGLVRAIYEDDELGFIRDHVDGEVNDWSAFTKGSATS
ncbi:hypothetical protein M527_07010 [Sphingobium indicum IP26]|uniref:Uncharacterized protein n=2 Tax=Sphingobium indicum TaxID=332055 RepID=A0A8E0WSI7_9SPHN|nr:hypothetical protein [Sphingobium sp. HDIP04]EPR09870.1 hypothetical protein M527_07010 [Sphingobium indicum IP26]EQB04998.1 hypothetical protein L286_09525 [Sphingobium sp. HDIP04]KER36663.1 hypothetical protein AL00_09315 [Sphingobium indicum F2]